VIEIIRTEYLETIEKLKDKPFIKILIGMRRCGKSTILNQFKNILLSKYSIKSSQIIDYNFNDLDLQKLSYGELYNKIISKSTVNSSNYIFLDEIQEIKEFEKCVISLFENKKYKFDIYITGSNSHLFSSELSTLFTGRNFPINVYPLSYKEYFNFFYKLGMEHKGFEKYIKYGSLGLIIPIIDEQNLIESSLKNILYDTINKDIKSRNNIKYSNGIELVIKYIYKNIGKEISLVNIENYLKSGREPKLTSKTISKYID
jgi:predicted AAA+ superfamily ATPase